MVRWFRPRLLFSVIPTAMRPFKTMEDELHGLVRDGSSLQSFRSLQRTSPAIPSINSSFLEIPTNFMDQVRYYCHHQQYGCWMDCYFDYKVAQPLAKYSLPSLQDPAYEHGRTIRCSQRAVSASNFVLAMIVTDCSFDPVRDIAPVDQFGFVDLKSALSESRSFPDARF